MTTQTPDPHWTAVDTYTYSHLHPSTSSTTPSHDALEHAIASSRAENLPDIAVSPTQGKFLKLQAQLAPTSNILEVGTLGGYSTIWLASSSSSARVTSIEISAHHASVARSNIAYAGLSDRAEVRVGSGLDVLPQIAQEVQDGKRGKFGFVFVDADKENNWEYVDLAIGMCEPGACIMVDNVVRRGSLVEGEGQRDSRIEGARRVVERVGRDSRIEGVVVQTVSEKTYDGFLMAIVK